MVPDRFGYRLVATDCATPTLPETPQKRQIHRARFWVPLGLRLAGMWGGILTSRVWPRIFWVNRPSNCALSRVGEKPRFRGGTLCQLGSSDVKFQDTCAELEVNTGNSRGQSAYLVVPPKLRTVQLLDSIRVLRWADYRL